MKKLVFGMFLIVGIICRSDAQLNGEYTFDIGDIFGTSPYTFQGFTTDEWDQWSTIFVLSVDGSEIKIPTASLLHNPLNGSFSLNGSVDFVTTGFEGNYVSEIYPESFNPQLAGDSWSISTDSTIRVIGKTYTDKKSKKSLLDISSGTITLKGTYTPAENPVVTITKGSITFRASKLDCNRLYRTEDYDYEKLKIGLTGSIATGKTRPKKLSNKSVDLNGLYWGGRGSRYTSDTFNSYESFYLFLNLITNDAAVTGTAKVLWDFAYTTSDDPLQRNAYFPSPETPAKEFTYSVKGTRKNGIATLNLTGLGVIKGLKATLYINESTQEIIKNGKNSITLYGQTITY